MDRKTNVERPSSTPISRPPYAHISKCSYCCRSRTLNVSFFLRATEHGTERLPYTHSCSHAELISVTTIAMHSFELYMHGSGALPGNVQKQFTSTAHSPQSEKQFTSNAPRLKIPCAGSPCAGRLFCTNPCAGRPCAGFWKRLTREGHPNRRW